MKRSGTGFAANCKRLAQRLQKESHVFYLVFKDRRTPWYAKLIAACSAAYLFSPIQLIPNFIPVIGSLDDALVVYVGIKLLQRLTPAAVFAECRDSADDAEVLRKQDTKSARCRR